MDAVTKLLESIPNPGNQNIVFTNPENYSIELVDLNGKAYEIKNAEIRIENFREGLYILRFRDKKGNETSKKTIIHN